MPPTTDTPIDRLTDQDAAEGAEVLAANGGDANAPTWRKRLHRRSDGVWLLALRFAKEFPTHSYDRAFWEAHPWLYDRWAEHDVRMFLVPEGIALLRSKDNNPERELVRRERVVAEHLAEEQRQRDDAQKRRLAQEERELEQRNRDREFGRPEWEKKSDVQQRFLAVALELEAQDPPNPQLAAVFRKVGGGNLPFPNREWRK